jgi:uncharacterized protein
VRTLYALSLIALGACRQTQTQPSVVPEPSNAAQNRAQQPSNAPPTGGPEAVRGPHVVIRVEGRAPITVTTEVARSEDDRNRGLMHRRELAPTAGMIFVFAQSEPLTFWMRNTFLPLDMIFIKSDRRVLGVVENATPMTDDPRRVEGDSQYVLEVNAGFAARHGITAGTVIEFVNIPPALN